MKSRLFFVVLLSVPIILFGAGCLKDVNVQRTLDQIASATNTSTGSSQPSVSRPQPTGTTTSSGGAGGMLSKVAPIVNNRGIVFSKTPITPSNPGNTSTSFQVGDHIYSLITLRDSFANLLKGKISKNATKVGIEIKIWVDEGYKDGFYLKPRRPAFNDTQVVMDIVPEIDKMTAFKDPDYLLESHGKPAGPITFAKVLGNLSPGKHRVKVEVYHYEVWAEGEFDITGSDYGFYAQQAEALADAATVANAMEPPKMRNPALENQMKKIARSRGYNVQKVVIIDPDWWVERHKISGRILWRHIASQVAYKKGGGCYFRKIRYRQMHSGGGYGGLQFMSEFDETKLPCDKI
jgi:hypothetical protein